MTTPSADYIPSLSGRARSVQFKVANVTQKWCVFIKFVAQEAEDSFGTECSAKYKVG